MRCTRLIASEQARAKHVTRARFVTHANLWISLLASEEIERLYIKFNGKLILNGLAVKTLHNQVTSLCYCTSFVLKIVDSLLYVNDEGEESEDDREFDALAKE